VVKVFAGRHAASFPNSGTIVAQASLRRGSKSATRGKGEVMIRKLPSGGYRLYSRKKDAKTGKRRNLGTFLSLAAARKHERAVQFFKRK
jgi:hypothetical protein